MGISRPWMTTRAPGGAGGRARRGPSGCVRAGRVDGVAEPVVQHVGTGRTTPPGVLAPGPRREVPPCLGRDQLETTPAGVARDRTPRIRFRQPVGDHVRRSKLQGIGGGHHPPGSPSHPDGWVADARLVGGGLAPAYACGRQGSGPARFRIGSAQVARAREHPGPPATRPGCAQRSRTLERWGPSARTDRRPRHGPRCPGQPPRSPGRP
jgi:hypothetical protein